MNKYLFYYLHERNINNHHEEVIFYRGLKWEPYGKFKTFRRTFTIRGYQTQLPDINNPSEQVQLEAVRQDGLVIKS